MVCGERAFVGLGSNLADPIYQLGNALGAMDAIVSTRLVACSALYRNPPLGAADQPDYVNAVAELSTALSPPALLARLQDIERAQGRVRGTDRWQARTLDLDLLLYGEREMCSSELVLPHPSMHERAFVLHPLLELAPDALVPGYGTVRMLASRVSAEGLIRIGEHAAV